MEWFIAELEELSLGVPHAGEAKLLTIANDLQKGRAATEVIAKYKAVAIDYTPARLLSASPREQDAFMHFLVQSELANDSIDLRRALVRVLKSRMNAPFDRLSQGIASSLLGSKSDVTSAMIPDLIAKVRGEHVAHPSWGLVTVLAALVGRATSEQYSLERLVDDLSLLSEQPDFAAELRLRNAVWKEMRPSSDSIELLRRVRRTQESLRHKFPETIASAVKSVRGAVYRN